MNALRLSAAVSAVAVILAAAGALSSCGPSGVVSDCTLPTLGETAADGGPDPCHCAPPPSLEITTCACLNGGSQDLDAYRGCMVLYADEVDAGEGGPIPGCNGECWPIPPPEWAPLLLWVGAESSAPPCPEVASAPVFGGYANGAFALACASSASGACPGFGDVCGPAGAEGFWQCAFEEGDATCPIVGPYSVKHTFYENPAEQSEPATFCCPAAPLPAP